MKPGPAILMYDIERVPALSWHWDNFNVNIPIGNLVKPGEICSFAARWYGSSKSSMVYKSVWADGKLGMISALRDLMDEADAEMGYNSAGFDRKHANTEILKLGLDRPSPSIQVDLWRVVKKHFKFQSSKLDFVSQELGVGRKVSHEGFKLWLKVMEGDKAAQRKFEKYNRQDVNLLADLYDRLLPWIDNHPNLSLYGGEGCPRCGLAGTLEKRGFRTTSVGRYQRYRCTGCGAWSSSGKAEDRTDIR